EGMGGHKKPDRRYFVGGWGGGRERPRGRAANKHNELPPFHIAAPGCKATPCGSEHSRSGRCNRARSRELPPADCQPDVRFGSKADISQRNRHVRFTPESGHSQCTSPCPAWAKADISLPSLDHFVSVGK